ncbi:hypothetical protein GJ744_008884 [Endocarpon pusillum]|uniref:Extradiol ring-cleavage dioxygenase class III enzyme subunit B domain-containing protein n=1 Tax=Endocarpon pusillum TaxID=364733 RepID=A0A8H7AYR4_9EURO|nr:hypothetical protein GJ744_008884 [Endocarpon pusillum]
MIDLAAFISRAQGIKTSLLGATELSRYSLRSAQTKLSPQGRNPPHTTTMTAQKTPIYFLSHGGPQTCHTPTHPVYPQLQSIGREISNTSTKPAAIVVFSAHWQSSSGPNTIEVNTSDKPLPLIYDFYGFPDHYYKTQFPYRASGKVSQRVMDVLNEGGVKAVGVERGLDHGVWVPFKVVFEGLEKEMPPIVQVSLFGAEDAEEHLRLGRVVARLREENILIVVSGMAVHNLRDMWVTIRDPKPLSYTASFDEALREAVESDPGSDRDTRMKELVKRTDVKRAHPTLEHLLPIHVGVGAAGSDRGKRLWTMGEGSLSWAQFRFGEVRSG